MGNGRLKQHEMLWGVVFIPVVMQPDWFKRFVKVTDIYFFIPAGSITEWPSNMHEALKIGPIISLVGQCLMDTYLDLTLWVMRK